MPISSDEPAGLIWRLPTYYGGGYNKKCLVEATIVECIREVVPPRNVPRDEVVAAGVRGIMQKKLERAGSKRHSTVPPGRSGDQSPAALALTVTPPAGPRPKTMRPRSTRKVRSPEAASCDASGVAAFRRLLARP
eukprot:TRINITY_DN25140_c0_g1_i2.p1 TRINITY_DN25140_c0_g1~~TRINITY_DN25140_c0_g1_i2.p1  ORF type:complete len:135 (-),score=15.01 TRINITY_DN25140_c0_g1_i2:121-525(-)